MTCVVEEASFQEKVDQGVERVPDEEEAVAAWGRRRQRLERGRVGHAQDHEGRGEGHECGLVKQVGRETGVGSCRVVGHCDQYGVMDELMEFWEFPMELKLY